MSARRAPPAWWYEPGRTPPWTARALAALDGAAVRLRIAAYRRGWLKQRRAGAPVVIVGNLVAGGSGKTPLVAALVERLRAAGHTPGIATRGYGRDEPDTPRWVEARSDPALAGDEPVLLARRTG
ncbi:MAG: tetraacyldisaccharide 4'-kinase, partial [Luteimonas sp.]